VVIGRTRERQVRRKGRIVIKPFYRPFYVWLVVMAGANMAYTKFYCLPNPLLCLSFRLPHNSDTAVFQRLNGTAQKWTVSESGLTHAVCDCVTLKVGLRQSYLPRHVHCDCCQQLASMPKSEAEFGSKSSNLPPRYYWVKF
jgi:hypothetical protein